jgi:2-hydroxy-6-oxonona-2,4-dienedioate hydrolase
MRLDPSEGCDVMTAPPSLASEPAAPESPDRGAGYRSVWRHLMDIEFRQGYVDALGLRTRFVEAGSPAAPALVMLHGTGGHWETFSANLPVLAQRFRCLAFDMLGCGFTDKPDRPYEIQDYVEHALAVLDVMGVERANFIGVSLGSWVACRLALTAPERVERLILNSPSGLLPLPKSAAAAVDSRRKASRQGNPSWADIQAILEHLLYDRSSLVDDIVAVRQRIYGLPGAQSERTLTLFDPEVRQRNLLRHDEWAAIAAPALIIAHVDAPDDYLRTGLAIAELMPNATVAELHQVSHWPQFEQPDAFNALALDFLSGC